MAFPTVASIIISSFVFGLFHFNLVQGIFAFAVGCLFAYVVQKTDRLLVTVAAHMLVNLVSLLRTETGLFGVLDQGNLNLLLTAVISLLLMFIFLSYAYPRGKRV